MACVNGRQYIVQPNDFLFAIAERELGDGNRWKEISKPDGNPFTENEAQNLKPGDVICLPGAVPAPIPAPLPVPAPTPTSKNLFVGFFQSWSEKWTANPNQLQLSNLGSHVNMVIASFMMPNAVYEKGSYSLGKKDAGTGLEFPEINGSHVHIKEAIALLKQKNPLTKVLISIGGDSYSKPGYFEYLNPQAIADVVQDFGFDGVDICFEPYRYFDPPTNAKCSIGANGQISCATDEIFRTTVSKVRNVLPRPYLITLSAWSIGAYGEGQWANAKPAKLPLTGLMLNLMRSPEAQLINQLNVMSYSGGSEYDPQEALAAYQYYFSGPITMGIHVPPEPYAPSETEKYVYTLTKVRELTQAVIDRDAAGVMLWSLQLQPEGTPTEDNPTPEMIAQAACQLLFP